MMRSLCLYLSVLPFWVAGQPSAPSVLITPPAKEQFCQIASEGATILPNGRIVRPMGHTTRIAPHPFGLTLSSDGRIAVTANSGNRPFSITILENPATPQPTVRQVPEGALNDQNLLEDVFMGLAITPDNQRVWVAGGQSNKIYQFDLSNGSKTDSIVCGTPENPDGYIGDMVLTRDGRTLYACDQSNFQLIIADTRTRTIRQRVGTGRYPFGIALSPDEKNAYIANVGMFEYAPIKNLRDSDKKSTGLHRPAFAFDSEAMREGIRNDSVEVPALGDPNVPESFSVWSIRVDGARAKLTHKVKTGFRIGEKIEGIPAVGGASPNSVTATQKYVFVSNGNNDCISVIHARKGKVIKNIFLKPLPALARLRGVIPFGVALSPDKKRLYVAESGLNAVAVIDVATLTVVGHLPVGWFPSKIAVTPDGKKLIVANAKGYGSGPNGGYTFKEGPEGAYVGHLMHGTVTALEIPADADLPRYTQQVLDHNFNITPLSDPAFVARKNNPIPLFPGEKTSPIKHIVFISKENRTYDEVFGQLKNGKGDPDIARYGYQRTFSNRAKTVTVEAATVMPNHLALARRFSIADNFYVDADHSADGHRWLANTYPNEWVETNVAAEYGGSRDVKSKSKEPGKWAWTGSAGAVFPEDYNEAGSMWDHLGRNNVPFYNWGFGTEMPDNMTDSTMKYYGQKVLVNFPVQAPLMANTSWRYPTYNMAIPDQFRADIFVQEFKEKWLSGKAVLPKILTIMLPNDHGAGERPAAGYPFRESYMADNDLALGRIVEFLSQTPYWKDMAIFITEDDAQDGRDHVDAHRSLLLVCSPYAKRNYVSHVHFSFGSIFKTFWNILGIPYLNQYDATAADLSDFFTETPDLNPWQALPEDARILDPQKLLTPFDAKFDWKSLLESPKLDNVEDFIRGKKD